MAQRLSSSSSTANATQGGAVNDFNGDKISDVLWENSSKTTLGYWSATNTNQVAWNVLTLDAGSTLANYQILGTGDFNGDGKTDILYQNNIGTVGYWSISNNNQLVKHDLTATAGSGYQVVGTGDYNGDGTSDILWYNASTTAIGDWTISNGTDVAWTYFGGTTGNDWKVVAQWRL